MTKTSTCHGQRKHTKIRQHAQSANPC